ncbi:MAG TPA: hypothetical protein VK453_18765 [Micromonosporaceae bacterium]|nr:hypothetical protein [Micromonosporaceae bacterium]
MTLSRHCGKNLRWQTPDSERFVGNTAGGVASNDSTYMTGEDYGGGVYVGPNNSSDGATINGYVTPTMNTHVCYSGGFSGAICGNYITAVGGYEDGIGPGFWTEQVHRTAPAGEGDSGGPVLAGSIGSGLNGIGVITLGDPDTFTTCQAIGDRLCSWRVFNVNLQSVLSSNGLDLITVP